MKRNKNMCYVCEKCMDDLPGSSKPVVKVTYKTDEPVHVNVLEDLKLKYDQLAAIVDLHSTELAKLNSINTITTDKPDSGFKQVEIPKIPEVSDPQGRMPTRPTSATQASKPVNNNNKKYSEAVTTKKASSTVNSNMKNKEGDFTEVKPRRMRGKNTPNSGAVGTRKQTSADDQGGCHIQAAERSAHVYVGRLACNTTENEITEHIKKNTNYEGAKVERLHGKSAFASFKISVVSTMMDTIKDPSLWPEGSIVNRYYFQKAQQSQTRE